MAARSNLFSCPLADVATIKINTLADIGGRSVERQLVWLYQSGRRDRDHRFDIAINSARTVLIDPPGMVGHQHCGLVPVWRSCELDTENANRPRCFTSRGRWKGQ